MPTARSSSQCPYCDHMSPAGSKFCNDCGAALHLRPCPHCGSVNDVTLSAQCSRCNGDLGFGAQDEPAPDEVAAPGLPLLSEVLEAAPSPAPLTDPMPVPLAINSAASFAPPAKSQRAPMVALALVALAGAAYFGLGNNPGSGPEPEPRPAPSVAQARPGTTVTERQAVLAPAVLAPAVNVPEQLPSTPAQASPEVAASVPAIAASLARLSPPGAGRLTPRRVAAVVPVPTPTQAQAFATESPPTERSGGSRRPGEGLDLKQPNIGSCTDAVAALGLCTAESNSRRP
ncbi:MAG: hypothetical protein IV107_00715 [Paucibacter sp.]|nr:hypothetical protein [Roseateles sp.]